MARRERARAARDERRPGDRDLQGGRPAARVRRALRASTTCRAATRSATRGWRPRAASRPSTRTRSRPGSTSASCTTARSRTTTACAARLRREGIEFQTDNDSEVAAGYLTWRLREGATLEQALEGCLEELDGFYTFAVGTADGFAVLRDPIACKPAVMAETDDWVAMASEYRAIAVLPGAEDARMWEPEPGARLQLGAGAGRCERSRAARRAEVVDLAVDLAARAERSAARRRGDAGPRRWRVVNPRGAHAVAGGHRRARSRSRSTATSATTAPA